MPKECQRLRVLPFTLQHLLGKVSPNFADIALCRGKENRPPRQRGLHWQLLNRMKFQNTYSAGFLGLLLSHFRFKAERQPPFAKALQATTMLSSYTSRQEFQITLYNQEVRHTQTHYWPIPLGNLHGNSPEHIARLRGTWGTAIDKYSPLSMNNCNYLQFLFADFRAAKYFFFSSGKQRNHHVSGCAMEGPGPQPLALQWPWSH